MKSGNVIRVKGVKDWKMKYKGNDITFLSIEQRTGIFAPSEKIIMGGLDLSQIEAVTVEQKVFD